MRKSLLTIFSLFFVALILSYLFGACRKEQDTRGLSVLPQWVPTGFPAPVYTFTDNPLTQEGFELGRRLFYDGRLSIDNNHSCASCHQQIAAFGTFEHDRSHGVNNTHTLRNAPVLFNLAWSNLFHWDGEFTSLYDEALHPLHGQTEMGESLDGIVQKLEKDASYRDLFKKVFGYPVIRPNDLLKALAQFTGFLVSADSRYDRYKRGTETFTPQEENGYNIYKANCATCHPEPLFTDFSLRNTGLPLDNFLQDVGRMRITGNRLDSLKFKVPTLRNTYISSNYMHDGRFGTLAQSINHYRTGVQQSATLDPLLTNGIPLTDNQAAELLLFLRTLTDSAFLKDLRFQRPQ